ncbi:MAG: hypothetical protein RI885_1327 [Actinomycetota bacterium]|jgi:GT2 family glycosyltransferase
MTTAPPSPRIGLIVVNYRSHDVIEQNLADLIDPPFPLTVVVVDNFSTEEEASAVASMCRRRGWEPVSADTNRGFGSGVNLGVARALSVGCSVFVLLNPDATLTVADLGSLSQRVATDRELVLSPRVVRPDGARWFDGGVVSVLEGTTRTSPGADSSAEGGWLTGACMALHADLWTRIGGFDDRYFLYWEDVDLSWRITEAGGRLAVARDLSAVHSVGGTQSTDGKSSIYVYYNCRNRLYFARDHLTQAQQRSWALSSIRYARSVLLRGGRRALARHPFGLISAAVRGTVAGLLALRRQPERG